MKRVKNFDQFVNEALSSGTYSIDIAPFGQKERELEGKSGIAISNVKGDVSMMIDEIVAEMHAKSIVEDPDPERLFSEMHGIRQGEHGDNDAMELFLVFDPQVAEGLDMEELKEFLADFKQAGTIEDYFKGDVDEIMKPQFADAHHHHKPAMGLGENMKHVKTFESFESENFDEELYDAISSILYAYDSNPSKQSEIEQFFAKFGVNNGQDTEKVIDDAIASGMTSSDAISFANDIGLEEE